MSVLDEAEGAQALLRGAQVLLSGRQQARNEAVRRAVAAGHPEREVAQRLRLAPSMIHKIVAPQSK